MQKIGLLFMQNYFVAFLGIAAAILSARGLAVETRGNLALIMLATQLLSRIGGLGFEPLIHKDGLSNNIIVYYISNIIGVVILLPIGLLMGVPDILGIGGLIFIAICGCLIAVLRINVAVFINFGKIRELAYVNIFQGIVQIIFFAVAFLKGTLWSFLLAWFMAVLMSVLLSVYLMKQIVKYNAHIPKFTEIIYIMRSGLRFSAIAIPELMLSFSIEIPIIRYVAGDRLVGLYSIAVTFNGVVYQAFSILSSIISKIKTFSRIYIYIAVVLLSTCLVAASPWIIEVAFGEEYKESYKLLQITMPMAILLGIMRVEYIHSQKSLPDFLQIMLAFILMLLLLIGVYIESEKIVYWISFVYSSYAIFYIFSVRRSGR